MVFVGYCSMGGYQYPPLSFSSLFQGVARVTLYRKEMIKGRSEREQPRVVVIFILPVVSSKAFNRQERLEDITILLLPPKPSLSYFPLPIHPFMGITYPLSVLRNQSSISCRKMKSNPAD